MHIISKSKCAPTYTPFVFYTINIYVVVQCAAIPFTTQMSLTSSKMNLSLKKKQQQICTNTKKSTTKNSQSNLFIQKCLIRKHYTENENFKCANALVPR